MVIGGIITQFGAQFDPQMIASGLFSGYYMTMIMLMTWILLIACLCYACGCLGLRVAGRWFGLGQGDTPGFVPTTITGLALVSFFSNLTSLVFPLGVGAALLFVAAGIAAAWLVRGAIRVSLTDLKADLRRPFAWAGILLCLAVLGVVLYKGSQPPLNYDTGLYHAQAIRWTQSYPAVPGLANFADRLGFNSTWLVFAALACGGWSESIPFFSPATLLFTLLVFEAGSRLPRLLRGELRAAHLLALIYLVMGRRLLTWELSSPGTDLPATLLLWLIFLYGLEWLQKGAPKKADSTILALTMASLLVVTIKLSAAPVLLLPAWLLIRAAQRPSDLQGGNQRRRPPAWSVGLLIGILFVLPWLARNVVLSGYLLYPLPQIDLFNFDWKVPWQNALASQQGITAWARWPKHSVEEVLGLPLTQWVPIWWSQQESVDRLMIVAIGVSWLVLAGWLIIRQFRRQKMPVEWSLALTLVSWLGAGYWFFQAPAFRFGYGFLGFLLAYPLALLAEGLLAALPPKVTRFGLYLALAGLLAYQGATLLGLRELAEWRSRWLWPSAFPVAEVRMVRQANFNYWFPASGNQCWAARLPCTAFPNQNAEMRAAELGQGFRTVVNP